MAEGSTEPKSITGIIRGCGKRVPGGLYVCTGLSPYGMPTEHFLIDPPIPYETEPFRAPLVFEQEGKKHLMLWVGAEYYPWASDFIEEVRNYGVSKRIPSGFAIEDLEPGSMLFLVHPKAIVKDHEVMMDLPEYCPKEIPEHLTCMDECCLGHSYALAPPTVGVNQRKLGDTVYTVYPQGMTDPGYEFTPGVFLRVPITHFDAVKTKDGKVDPAILGKGMKLPINIEDE